MPKEALLAFKSAEKDISIAHKKEYAILIDYTKPIFSKRMWLIDLEGNVHLNCHVSHAHKSGWLFANDFSNQNGSKKSCKGLFITQNQYTGSFGNSMRIKGLIPEINDGAYSRYIVFHPIPKYKIWGFTIPEELLWFSDGCFATTGANMDILVNKASDGAFVFVYAE